MITITGCDENDAYHSKSLSQSEKFLVVVILRVNNTKLYAL